MYTPPSSPRDPPSTVSQTWSDVASAYLLVVAIPVLLWFVANPLVSGATVLGLLSLRTATRRARASLGYARKQCCTVLRVGERVRITLIRRPAEG